MPKTKTQITECVLFDWDGTLFNSFAAEAHAYARMFSTLGMQWSLEKLKRHYSPNWYNVYRAVGLPRVKWEQADRLWRKFYGEHQPEMQPGALAVLRRLDRRFTLGLVSAGSRVRVRRQLREQNVAAMFRTKVCGEDAPRRKPHPAPLRLALSRLHVSPEVCVYIGDAPEDMEMARRAGMRAVGVLGGSPIPERLRQSPADAMIETIRELPALLEEW